MSARTGDCPHANHGIADVYLGGTKVATVDGYGPSKASQQVFYAAGRAHTRLG